MNPSIVEAVIAKILHILLCDRRRLTSQLGGVVEESAVGARQFGRAVVLCKRLEQLILGLFVDLLGPQ